MYNSLGEKQETKQQLKYVGKEKESEKKKILFIQDFPHIFMFQKYKLVEVFPILAGSILFIVHAGLASDI